MKKTRKTILSLVAAVLCLVIALPVTLFGAMAADNTLKLVVASDFHVIPVAQYGTVGDTNGLPDSGIYGHVNNTKGALNAESSAIFKRFLSDLSGTSSKYVLITGDIVDMGSESSHEYAAGELAKAAKKTGKKILVVPGNNDVCYSFSKKQFEETYKDFGFSDALARHPGSLSYTYDLDDNYRLIAIDSTVYVENKKVDTGEISPDLLQWVVEQAAQAKADGKYPIAMMHHSVLKHTKGIASLLVDFTKDAFVKAPLTLANTLADAGIRYLFSGHIHSFDISGKGTIKGNSIYDVATGSLSAYPCAYRRVNFSDSSVSFTTKYVTKIDKQYLPEGYTDEQLQSIKADFTGYAYGVAETSLKFTANKYINDPDLIIDKLQIEKDSELAAEIGRLLPIIYDYLGRPLYKQEQADGSSFEELAVQYRCTLPESEYQTAYDVAAKLMTSHMAGDENVLIDDVEITLLKDVLKITFLETLKQSDTDLSALLEKLNLSAFGEKVFNYVASFNFKETVADMLVDIVMEPIVEGITADAYDPDDNNPTLPSYSAESIIPSGFEKAYIMFIKILELTAKIVHTVFHIA